MSDNSNMCRARKEKNDEFYTQLSDIEKELSHYWPHFRNKTVLCNCDDPYESNFTYYFLSLFNHLGLKRLICTSHGTSKVAGRQLTLFDTGNLPKGEPIRHAYYLDITRDDFKPYADKGQNNPITRCDPSSEEYKLFIREHTECLKGDGDFRSPECVALLGQADIVVTNPPFSLFRTYISQLVGYGKKFIVLGDKAIAGTKDVFPLIKEDKVWLGYCSPKSFMLPDGTLTDRMNGKCRWYTNLSIDKRYEPFSTYYKYNPVDYPKYDNYDAIEVGEVKKIPCDYTGIMGVPITFLDRYNPDQFEIINAATRYALIDNGFTNPKGTYGTDIGGKHNYTRVFVRWRKLPEHRPCHPTIPV